MKCFITFQQIFDEKPKATSFPFAHSKSFIHSSPTYNPLDDEVIDLLAGICPEEFSVLSADLLWWGEKKVNIKNSVSNIYC